MSPPYSFLLSLPHASFHPVFGLPLLFPGSAASNPLPTTCSSLIICPYHFNLFSVTFSDASVTLVVPLMCSFRTLSSLLRTSTSASSSQHPHLSILTSASSSQHPHLSILISASSSQHPHLSILISASASQHPHLSILISASSSQHPHLSILISASSSQHPHLSILISASSSQHPHLSILISFTSILASSLRCCLGLRSIQHRWSDHCSIHPPLASSSRSALRCISSSSPNLL